MATSWQSQSDCFRNQVTATIYKNFCTSHLIYATRTGLTYMTDRPHVQLFCIIYIFYILPHIIILDAIPSDTSLWFTSITLKVKLLFLQILKHALCQCYQSTRKLVLFTCQSQFSLSFGTWWVLILDPVGNAIVNHKFYITRFLWDFKNCIRLYVNCNETLQMQNSAFNSRPTYSNE